MCGSVTLGDGSAGSIYNSKMSSEEMSRDIKLEFMFMKHYALNRCKPSIEALNFRGEGVIRADVNGEVKFL